MITFITVVLLSANCVRLPCVWRGSAEGEWQRGDTYCEQPAVGERWCGRVIKVREVER